MQCNAQCPTPNCPGRPIVMDIRHANAGSWFCLTCNKMGTYTGTAAQVFVPREKSQGVHPVVISAPKTDVCV